MKYSRFTMMKGWLVVLVLLVAVRAQSQQKDSKNYIGAFAVLDFTNTSLGGAVEYERWLLIKRKWVLSAKADYIFEHKTANMVRSYDALTESTRQVCVMASGTFFTGKRNDHEGFFLGFSGGVNYTEYREKVNTSSNQSHMETVAAVTRPGYELFGGGQVNFPRGGSFRITSGVYTFYSQRAEFPDNLPLVMFYAKVSFGF